MAFLAQTPQEEISTAIQETGEQTKQAMMWMAVIAVIVIIILFAGKR